MERKLLTASSPFGAVRDGQFTMPRFVDVDLTTARTEQTALEIPIAGNVLYCDANPNDGACVIEFNDVGRDPGTDTPFYASPGFIANVPYTRIRVFNDAQPGKKIRIVYGVDIPFQPGSVAQVTIRSSVPTYTAAQSRAAIATASTVAVPANSSRKYLKIVNNGANAITLNEGGGTAVLNQGHVLAAGGGWFEWNANVPTNQITAIAATAATTVEVIEGT